MPHALIERQTLIFDGEQAHYGDSFQECRLVLTETGKPRFLNCTFLDREFDPPLLENLSLWQDGKMFSCIVNPTHTQVTFSGPVTP